MEKLPKYWFPAKKYGWGWGLPSRWQGWLVTLAYFTVAIVLSCVINLETHLYLYIGSMTVLTVAFIGVCYLKGEPPKWSWGGSAKEEPLDGDGDES